MTEEKTHSELAARDIQEFRSDIIALFKKEKGGHIARWVYHDGDRGGHQPTGKQLWGEFIIGHNGYYVLREEIELIQDDNKKLCNAFKDADAIIDLGSGESDAVENKAMLIVLGCPNVKIYCPIDLSSGLLAQATAKAESIIKLAANDDYQYKNKHLSAGTLEVKPLCFNFYKALSENVKIPGERRAGLVLGSTITNVEMMEGAEFPREIIKDNIKRLANITKSGTSKPCTLTFGYDVNPDLKDAKAGYDHEKWKQLIVGIMFDVENILQPEGYFNPVGWEHKTIIDEKNHVLHQCVVATKNQAFSIENESFDIQKGDRFVIKNNFKDSYDIFGEIVKECGYKLHEPMPHPSGRMLLQTIDI